MPRFAANLGFTPLEPMKPTSAAVAAATSAANNLNGKSPAAISTASSASNALDVPATEVPVLFDWKSSGLVNPLDGM